MGKLFDKLHRFIYGPVRVCIETEVGEVWLDIDKVGEYRKQLAERKSKKPMTEEEREKLEALIKEDIRKSIKKVNNERRK